jgi:hypothetical protein
MSSGENPLFADEGSATEPLTVEGEGNHPWIPIQRRHYKVVFVRHNFAPKQMRMKRTLVPKSLNSDKEENETG